MLAKYHSPPQVLIHDFAISSIVESSLLTSRSNHDGRTHHVQQNPGLHTTLKPAVSRSDHQFDPTYTSRIVVPGCLPASTSDLLTGELGRWVTLVMVVTLDNDDIYVESPFNLKITLAVHTVRSYIKHMARPRTC